MSDKKDRDGGSASSSGGASGDIGSAGSTSSGPSGATNPRDVQDLDGRVKALIREILSEQRGADGPAVPSEKSSGKSSGGAKAGRCLWC